jgi:hypothetical protein
MEKRKKNYQTFVRSKKLIYSNIFAIWGRHGNGRARVSSPWTKLRIWGVDAVIMVKWAVMDTRSWAAGEFILGLNVRLATAAIRTLSPRGHSCLEKVLWTSTINAIWFTLFNEKLDIQYLQLLKSSNLPPSMISKGGFANVAPYQQSYVAPHQPQEGKLDWVDSLRWSIRLYICN